MICLMSSQVRLSVAGSWAMAFQKLLIQSVLRVAMMSSYCWHFGACVFIFNKAKGRHFHSQKIKTKYDRKVRR